MTASPFLQYCFLCLCLLTGGIGSAAHAQIEELPRPDSAHAGSFGVSVAIGDTIAAVGTSGEATCGPNAGAIYVYRREPDSVFAEWKGVTRLTPANCQSNAFFGEEVVVSGGRLFVSASTSEPLADEGANTAYMFAQNDEGEWRQTARFSGSAKWNDGPFAADIDLDGNRAVVSTMGNPETGDSGAVYVYEYNAQTKNWTQSARLTSNRESEVGILGRSVALDGNRIAVAASTYFKGSPGSVYIFEQSPSGQTWYESALLRGFDSFFIELDLYNATLLVGEDRAGDEGSGRATIVTDRGKRGWMKTATLQPKHPYESGSFGTAVALQGRWALVTGYGEQLEKDFNIDRVVYVFRQQRNRSWTEQSLLDIGQVDFGAALDQYDSTAIVSSVPDDAPGSVYVVQLR